MNLRVKDICKENGITIGELADRMQMVRESLSRAINGNPTLDTLERIATTLTHKFRCKTKGGDFDLGNYIYVFDKKMDSIIYKEDIDDESNDKIKSLIDEAINSKDEHEEQTDANTGATQSSTADSLASALKGEI